LLVLTLYQNCFWSIAFFMEVFDTAMVLP
jgi:hypothetical protein